LWIGESGQLEEKDVPKCEHCGADRICEFQILPQLLSELKVTPMDPNEPTLDWGILTIYTCKENCQSEGGQYIEEFLWRQNIM